MVLQQGFLDKKEFEPVSLDRLRLMAVILGRLDRRANKTHLQKGMIDLLKTPMQLRQGTGGQNIEDHRLCGHAWLGEERGFKRRSNHGLEVVVMGDVIRGEAARLGLPPTDENLGNVGNMLRAREGPKAVAKRTLELARSSGKDLVVVDGLRSKEEVEFFRDNSNDFMLVEVCASAEARLSRIANRGRSDDANSEDETKSAQRSPYPATTAFKRPQRLWRSASAVS